MSQAAPSATTISRANKRNDAILGAGLTHFLADGFSATRVEDVARDAGVVKQTIYNRFGGKDGLFTAVLQHAQDRTLPEEMALLAFIEESEGDPEAILIEAGVRWLRLFLREELILLRRLVMAEAARHPEFRDIWQQGAPKRFHATLTAFFLRHARNGALDVDEPERVAAQYIALVGTEGQARAADLQLSDDAALREIAAFHTCTLVRAWRRPDQSSSESTS